MRVLLDTCTFLWLVIDAPELSDSVRKIFVEVENEVYLSAVSTWEIALQYSLGRLRLPIAPEQYIPEQRTRHEISFLPLHEDAALFLKHVPRMHKDPFDRMLICQALVHDLIILTPDPLISQYAVGTMW